MNKAQGPANEIACASIALSLMMLHRTRLAARLAGAARALSSAAAPPSSSHLAAIKALREASGAPMSDVKAALVEAGWDADGAFAALRQRGLAAAQKKVRGLMAVEMPVRWSVGHAWERGGGRIEGRAVRACARARRERERVSAPARPRVDRAART